MSIEAMKQALEALEQHGTPLLNHEDAYSASLIALRQAIAAAEKQEPVACPYCHCSATLGAVYFDQNCAGCVKRMIHPQPKREWVSLTDLEIDQIYCDHHDNNGDPISLGYERALEAKLWEKNK
jgi:hypothetical protein